MRIYSTIAYVENKTKVKLRIKNTLSKIYKDLEILILALIMLIKNSKKIGSLFKQLDETIALHQRKLDLLKEQKNVYIIIHLYQLKLT